MAGSGTRSAPISLGTSGGAGRVVVGGTAVGRTGVGLGVGVGVGVGVGNTVGGAAGGTGWVVIGGTEGVGFTGTTTKGAAETVA